MNDMDTTRKLTITANSVHGEKEIMWALRATDLILALHEVRETFIRLRNDGINEETQRLGEGALQAVNTVVTDYNLTDLLETVT